MRPLENNILGGFEAIIRHSEKGTDDQTENEEN
jgi:hypothetical protein